MGILEQFIVGGAPLVAPEFDSIGAGASGNTNPVLAWSHTVPVSGKNRFLVIAIGYAMIADNQWVTAVTVDGSPATLIDRVMVPSFRHTNELYGFVAPPTGTVTVSVSFAGNGRLDQACNSINYTGVNQSTPTILTANNIGTSTDPTVTIVSDAEKRVVNSVYHDGTPVLSLDPGATERFQVDPTANDGTLGLADAIGTASKTVDWTLSASEQWATVSTNVIGLPSTTFARAEQLVVPAAHGSQFYDITTIDGVPLSEFSHIQVDVRNAVGTGGSAYSLAAQVSDDGGVTWISTNEYESWLWRGDANYKVTAGSNIFMSQTTSASAAGLTFSGFNVAMPTAALSWENAIADADPWYTSTITKGSAVAHDGIRLIMGGSGLPEWNGGDIDLWGW
jgi:hypothetical protein